MSNLHKNCLWSISLIRRTFEAKFNCAKYKKRVVGVRVTDRMNRKKYSRKIIIRPPRRITLHRTFALFANNFFRCATDIYSSRCSHYTGNHYWLSNYSKQLWQCRVTNHDPPGKFDQSNGALYTARHENSSRNGFFKAPYFRMTLLFFSLAISPSPIYLFRICSFRISRVHHDKHAAKSL